MAMAMAMAVTTAAQASADGEPTIQQGARRPLSHRPMRFRRYYEEAVAAQAQLIARTGDSIQQCLAEERSANAGGTPARTATSVPAGPTRFISARGLLTAALVVAWMLIAVTRRRAHGR